MWGPVRCPPKLLQSRPRISEFRGSGCRVAENLDVGGIYPLPTQRSRHGKKNDRPWLALFEGSLVVAVVTAGPTNKALAKLEITAKKKAADLGGKRSAAS